ncbi:hypothetical protein CesoFtcFv8_027871 [Champsocephalus esox]|uniref:Uncharacterized protein n=1 Tax=Champsocephalus esox TaxID=159716 RepID=A0AAN8AZ75_9TELE|nr:hypothetical protein CesoFtcFv8_027871 [Champsocephalus esox]
MLSSYFLHPAPPFPPLPPHTCLITSLRPTVFSGTPPRESVATRPPSEPRTSLPTLPHLLWHRPILTLHSRPTWRTPRLFTCRSTTPLARQEPPTHTPPHPPDPAPHRRIHRISRARHGVQTGLVPSFSPVCYEHAPPHPPRLPGPRLPQATGHGPTARRTPEQDYHLPPQHPPPRLHSATAAYRLAAPPAAPPRSPTQPPALGILRLAPVETDPRPPPARVLVAP